MCKGSNDENKPVMFGNDNMTAGHQEKLCSSDNQVERSSFKLNAAVDDTA